MWRDDQWDGFCGLLEGWWPGEFSEPAAKAWRIAMDGVPPDAAIAGLSGLLQEGRRFRPSASELLAILRSDPSKPTFDEMLVLLRRAMKAAEPTERLAQAHPLVLSFVERQGWDRLRTLPLDDPDWGEKTRRDLEGAWDRHCDAFDGREVAALSSGQRDGLRQLDPLAALGVKPLQIEGSS